MDDMLWFENPETGAVFGFGDPLPSSIADQIQAGQLRPCDPPQDAAPASPDTEPEPKADGTGEDDGDADAATEPELGFEPLPEAEPLPEPEKPRRGGRRPV